MSAKLRNYLTNQGFGEPIISNVLKTLNPWGKHKLYGHAVNVVVGQHRFYTQIKAGKKMKRLNKHKDPLVTSAGQLAISHNKALCRATAHALSFLIPPTNYPNEGILGKYDDAEAERVAAILRKDGMYVFPQKLSAETCASLRRQLNTHTFKPRYISKGNLVHGIQLDNPQGTSHWTTDENRIAEYDEVQQIIADPTLIQTVAKYLGTTPTLAQTNAWWSVGSKKFGADTTHAFHKDYGNAHFIKVFVYLNDIGTNDGPHVFTKGSHNGCKFKYRPSSRVSAKTVNAHYPGAITEILGGEGTVALADTSGFHKGKCPGLGGHRIVLQFQFAATHSGLVQLPPRKPPVFTNPQLLQTIEDNPYVYSKYRYMAIAK